METENVHSFCTQCSPIIIHHRQIGIYGNKLWRGLCRWPNNESVPGQGIICAFMTVVWGWTRKLKYCSRGAYSGPLVVYLVGKWRPTDYSYLHQCSHVDRQWAAIKPEPSHPLPFNIIWWAASVLTNRLSSGLLAGQEWPTCGCGCGHWVVSGPSDKSHAS